MKRRVVDEALIEIVVNHFNHTEGATTRSTAKACDVPKTTVYKILTQMAPNRESAIKLAENGAEKARRGGQATKGIPKKRK